MFSRLYKLLLLSVTFFLSCDQAQENPATLSRIAKLEEKITKLEKKVKEVKIKQTSEPVATITTPALEPISEVQYQLSGNEKDDPFLGPPGAELILMAFYDYESQASRRFAQTTLKELRENEIKAGYFKFLLRDFPLSGGPTLPAMFAQCAGEQGKYWQAFDTLNSSDMPQDIMAIAKTFSGVDQKKLDRCMHSTRYEAEVQRDILDGHTLGVKGAPAFFFGRCKMNLCSGKFIRGAQPLGVFQSILKKLSGTAEIDSPQSH